ncbi:MAG: DUF4926 domain-containing protein [Chloroflexi bacterium]|nr:DUF4926 domain-containing protein [Chloroflexota bacterium]
MELVHDIPEYGLLAGTQGTIVESHGNNAYAVGLVAIRSRQHCVSCSSPKSSATSRRASCPCRPC